MSCDCKCSVLLPHDAMGLSAVVIVFFSCLYSLTFAYLVSSFCNECFIHSTILNKVQAFKVINEK